MLKENQNPGQWEVVGGNTKSKGKAKSPTGKKDGGKNGSGSAPQVIKVDELVTPMDTQFAMLDPELKAQAKRQALGLPPLKPAKDNKAKSASAATASKEVAKKKPSKDSGKEKEKAPKTLPEALKLIQVAELNEAIATIKARFPGSPLVWLKELNSYLNNNLIVETDPLFSGKPRDYPSSLLTPELKSVITTTIQSCEEEVLHLFYESSLITIPADMNRGVPVCGTKILLQLLSFHKPDLVLSHLDKAREILNANESRIPVNLSLLWVLSQSSFKETRVGIQVWVEAMLPLIGLKNYNQYVAQLASYLTAKAPGIKLSKKNLSVADYFKLGDQIESSTLPANVRRDVADFFQALTLPMITAHGSKMFVQYLRRLTTASCRNLLECLRADDESYEIWRKEYRANLAASAILLQWIADHEENLAQESPEFRETLLHFQTVHDAITPSSKVPQQALKKCVGLCEALISNVKPKKRPASKLKFLNYLLLISLVSLVYYDVRIHGDNQFAKSRIGKASERYGVTAKVGQLHQQAQPYLLLAGARLAQLRDVIYDKGEQLSPGIWADLNMKYQAGLVVAKEKSAVAYAKASEYADVVMIVAADYWARFDVWSAPYRKQLLVQAEKTGELLGVYFQQAKLLTTQFLDREDVKSALKFTYDLYHKALHAVGLCSH